MIVSKALQNRLTYGEKNPVKYIMVHQTANTSRGANAYMHARLQANGNSRVASWHYQVDASNIYQSFPDTAQAWHAGNAYYNRNSIGIELTVNSDGNYNGTVEHGAELVKYLMNKHNVPISRVIRHKDASGKHCPRELLNGKNGITWAKFKQMVQGKEVTTSTSKPKAGSTVGAKHIKDENAYFQVTVDEGIKVRNAPSTSATHTGTLEKGDSVNYFKVYDGNGFRWLQYKGNSGNTLYVPYRASGSGQTQWGSFHDERPEKASKPKPKNNLAVEGSWGPAVTTALQKHYGTTVDGKITGQPNNQSVRNIPSATTSGSGSLLITAMQKDVGTTQDGKISDPSLMIRAMQKRLGTPQDGHVSNPSLMVKEMQRRLNNGTF